MSATTPTAAPAEEILEPDLPIIDAHHHLWDDARSRYLLDEYLADVNSGHNIRASVFVECVAMYRADGPEALRSAGEVEFANGIAAMSASGGYGPARLCAAIIGHADLRVGAEMETVLDAMERAGGGRFRGLRQMATHDPELRTHPTPGFLRDPQFHDGFRRLQQRGHGFEAWLYHPQLSDLIALMEVFPEARVVLNHIGGRIGIGRYVPHQDEVMRSWTQSIKDLSRYPNLTVKLGGLGMPLCGFGFETRTTPVASAELAQAWRPYFEICLEAFGVERCMFESNFPVDRVSCTYPAVWNAFKRIAAGFSVAEKAALFSETAARVYRIDLT
jgi:L-fuconolactonase